MTAFIAPPPWRPKPYRDEATEIDHLEGPELRTVVTMTGSTACRRTPPHRWTVAPFGIGERCARCHLERFEAITKPGGEPEKLYRLSTGQMRAGAEPYCVLKAALRVAR